MSCGVGINIAGALYQDSYQYHGNPVERCVSSTYHVQICLEGIAAEFECHCLSIGVVDQYVRLNI